MADLKSSGLHVFRTSLRKLLTVLEMLDLAPAERSALNGMFSTAGRWRDAQVKDKWLGGGAKGEGGESPERSMELKRWHTQFTGIAARLKPALEAVASAPAAERKKLSEKIRRAILDQASEASKRLGTVRDENDSEGLHSARLTIKRLGDLIEAFTGESPGQIRNLQDLLGGIHDRDMILHSLPSSAVSDIARAKAERRKLLDQLYSVDKP
ncbi:MAG: CHAD domain-containing protein [Elusimicrobia bacterium]|nr:CHAD domain-containing protein [Elusimicrobiota bacterium]